MKIRLAQELVKNFMRRNDSIRRAFSNDSGCHFLMIGRLPTQSYLMNLISNKLGSSCLNVIDWHQRCSCPVHCETPMGAASCRTLWLYAHHKTLTHSVILSTDPEPNALPVVWPEPAATTTGGITCTVVGRNREQPMGGSLNFVSYASSGSTTLNPGTITLVTTSNRCRLCR